jgi:hypothetical protein
MWRKMKCATYQRALLCVLNIPPVSVERYFINKTQGSEGSILVSNFALNATETQAVNEYNSIYKVYYILLLSLALQPNAGYGLLVTQGSFITHIRV